MRAHRHKYHPQTNKNKFRKAKELKPYGVLSRQAFRLWHRTAFNRMFSRRFRVSFALSAFVNSVNASCIASFHQAFDDSISAFFLLLRRCFVLCTLIHYVLLLVGWLFGWLAVVLFILVLVLLLVYSFIFFCSASILMTSRYKCV